MKITGFRQLIANLEMCNVQASPKIEAVSREMDADISVIPSLKANEISMSYEP